jgi:starch-binding outer membrane protein SusE/F
MKRIQTIILAIAAITLIWSCTEDPRDPVIDYAGAPVITSTAPTGAITLTEANGNTVVLALTWNAADFGFQSATQYKIEMDVAGNNFAAPFELALTNKTNFDLTGKLLNNSLLAMEKPGDVPVNLQIRVVSTVSQYAENQISGALAFVAVPFEAKLPPIYLLGGGTDAGWDNTKALTMPYYRDGVYGIAATLKANDYWKMIRNLGAWAPQWGTDGTGTTESGKLAYRPDENTADPASIPTPAVAGDYWIVVDVKALTYKVYPLPQTIYLVGGATTAGWTPASGLPFTKNGVGKYSITTTLSASEGFKIMATNSGAWAPQWGTDANGLSSRGKLAYRNSDADPDPAMVPAPTEAGNYKIEVDFTENTYKVTKQ